MDCPQCHLINPATAEQCDCGRHFVAGVGDSAGSGLGDQPQRPVLYAAPFWRRSMAWLVDCIILFVFCGMPALAIGFVLHHGHGAFRTHVWSALGAVGAVVAWLYFATMESAERQATAGKVTLGLRVVDVDGKRLGFGRASLRFWAKLLSALPLGIGLLMPVVTKRRQALHDRVTGTIVIDKRARAHIRG